MFLHLNAYCADRDVMEVAKEIVATITDPQGMVGPEVCIRTYMCYHPCSYLVN